MKLLSAKRVDSEGSSSFQRFPQYVALENIQNEAQIHINKKQ
jgi:hypothetical protein